MSILDAISNFFGKTPTLSDMEKAVEGNNAELLKKLAGRLSPEGLKTMVNPMLKKINGASMFAAIDGILKQKKVAVTLTETDKKVVASNIGRRIHQNIDYLTVENVNFLRENLSDDRKKFSLNSFTDKEGRTFYDKDNSPDKRRYFAVATEEEIGHEFRKLVVGLDTKKVDQFMESYKKAKGHDINPDVVNSKGMTGMWYMNYLMEKDGQNNADEAKRIENMASFLYEKGAKLTDKDGKSIFSRASASVLGKLLPQMEEKNDSDGLKIVDQMANWILENPSPSGRITMPSNMLHRAVEQENIAKVKRTLENPSPSGRIGPVDGNVLRKVLQSSQGK